jgi:hypothetical protein
MAAGETPAMAMNVQMTTPPQWTPHALDRLDEPGTRARTVACSSPSMASV